MMNVIISNPCTWVGSSTGANGSTNISLIHVNEQKKSQNYVKVTGDGARGLEVLRRTTNLGYFGLKQFWN